MCADSVQASVALFTHSGIGTVRIWPPLPTRSAICNLQSPNGLRAAEWIHVQARQLSASKATSHEREAFTDVVQLNYGCCCCAKVRAALVLDSDVILGLQGYPDPHQEASNEKTISRGARRDGGDRGRGCAPEADASPYHGPGPGDSDKSGVDGGPGAQDPVERTGPAGPLDLRRRGALAAIGSVWQPRVFYARRTGRIG